jgi:hypothetical protein
MLGFWFVTHRVSHFFPVKKKRRSREFCCSMPSQTETLLEDAAAALTATYLDELFEGVFHEHIATAGRTLTFVSVATYAYQRLSKLVLAKSSLSYSLDAHLRFAYERAVLSTNEFVPRLADILENGDPHRRSQRTSHKPSSGRASPAAATASSPILSEEASVVNAASGFLPLDAIKVFLRAPGLSKQDKLTAWGEIRRMSLAYFLVVSYMRVLFLSACTVRNALLVVINLEEQAALAKAKSQSKNVTSKWSLMKRFLQSRRNTADDGTGETTSAFLLEMMMNQALGAVGSAGSSSPFSEDGPEGLCCPAVLMDIVLASTEDVVRAALLVVDATLTHTDPVDRGECDEDDLSILLDVLINSFQPPEPWIVFARIKDECVDRLTAALQEHQKAVVRGAACGAPGSLSNVDGGGIAAAPFMVSKNGSLTGSTAGAPSVSANHSSRQLSRCASEESDAAAASEPLPTIPDDDTIQQQCTTSLPHGASSRSSSFHLLSNQTPFELPANIAARLAAYLFDALCTSDDVGVICEALLSKELARLRSTCLESFVDNPKYGNGKRATLVAASQLDKFRQQVKDQRAEDVPATLKKFCEELLKVSTGHL